MEQLPHEPCRHIAVPRIKHFTMIARISAIHNLGDVVWNYVIAGLQLLQRDNCFTVCFAGRGQHEDGCPHLCLVIVPLESLGQGLLCVTGGDSGLIDSGVAFSVMALKTPTLLCEWLVIPILFKSILP